jgi:cellulose biosynthesis protein BcsQ
MHDTCTSTLTLCSRTCSSSRTARAASPRRASLPTSPGWPPRLAGRCWRSTSTPQGNLARDLGYLDRSDGRQGLLAAVLLDQEHSVLEAVRPLGTARGTGCSDAGRLDVVAGKPRVARLSDQLGIEVARFGPAGYVRLSKVIGALAPAYDLFLCDLPPGDGAIGRAALRMGRFVLIPTLPDDAGIDGLGRVFAELQLASGDNPGFEVLGVVLTLVVSGASAVERRAQADLEVLRGGKVKVFEHTIRFA